MTRVPYLDGPVAIIGAGIGGLTAALSLQHFDLPVRVFEQARALRRKPGRHCATSSVAPPTAASSSGGPTPINSRPGTAPLTAICTVPTSTRR